MPEETFWAHSKKHWTQTLFLMAIGALVLIVANSISVHYRGYGFFEGNSDYGYGTNTITITGTGEVTAKADSGMFIATLQLDAATESAARAAIDSKEQALMKYLEGKGVAAADIKFSDYTSYPQDDCETYYYSHPEASFCPSTYQTKSNTTASETMTVTIRDVSQMETLIWGVRDLGTPVDQTSTKNSQDTALKNEARDLAIKDARTKAEATAKSLGVRLGRIVSFDDGQSLGYDGYNDMGSLDYIDSAYPGTVSTPSNDEVKITATVSVIYEIH